MHFYFPRRHRRRLLFPPGLLALGCLLWLGCLALRAHEGQFKVKTVIDLTMPALLAHANTELILLNGAVYQSRQEIAKFRAWKTVYFTRVQAHHAQEKMRATTAIENMLSSNNPNAGVRIIFSHNSNYEQLIYALNLIQIYNIRKYWVDIRYSTVTLYALKPDKEKHWQDDSSHYYGCLSSPLSAFSILPHYRPGKYLVRFDDWITELWNPNPAEQIYSPYPYEFHNKFLGPERQYMHELLATVTAQGWLPSLALLLPLMLLSYRRIRRGA